MTLNKRYFFEDFTIDNYRKLLLLARKHYDFFLFSEYENAPNKNIFLRHDIEFSIPIAEKMAQIEHELGIKATYFLQLHSEFYNPFDKEHFKKIQSIKDMGHEIGLHFDSHFWDVRSENELDSSIQNDKEIIEKIFDIKLKAFSFHNTDSFILSCNKEKYSGLLNVYSRYFKEKIGYCSDSTGFWRYERLEDRLKEAVDDQLQILVHDGMWQNEVLPPRQRVFKVIDERADFLKNFYDDTLKKFGAKNIDWDEIL